MKKLNFFPYYEPYLRSGAKTTTLRLRPPATVTTGDAVEVSVGWEEESAISLYSATITAMYSRRVSQLTAQDLEGESPDCRSPETSILVLGAIYRTLVRDDDDVWVIKFVRA